MRTEVDELFLCQGSDLQIAKGITLHHPTMREIANFGEEKYMSVISSFTTEPFDIPYQLSKMGIDFTEIDSYTLFCVLCSALTQSETALLFGDLDFSKFKRLKKDSFYVLVNSDGVEINELTAEVIKKHIRKMHSLPQQRHTKVYNEFAKNQLITDGKNDALRAKRKRDMFGYKSAYLPLISSVIADKGMFYTWETVWDIHIYQLLDSIKRMQKRDNANHLYQGIYSGSIDAKKIDKKTLDWFSQNKD